ncbi:MAG: 16S rRNA (guanine(527)-N(7))-methyltransferase RsmG [Nitrospirae bacterium]|nr:MAG: 16S rRNA (guanine(527)-N(7))-methyltransferase RsmG [Nitrospirota bacterium]
MNDLAKLLLDSAREVGVSVTNRNVSELLIYLRELISWNKKTNLTAIRQDREIVVKHFIDSIACSKALGQSKSSSLLDVGAGAGFPGLPLKIIHPELNLTLLEPNNKKTAFLRHVIGTLNLSHAVVVPKRIEDCSRELQYQGRFTDIITRALDVDQVIPFVRPLLAHSGRLILCRAKPLDSGLNLFGLQIKNEIAYELPYGYGKRVLLILEPAHPT